MNDELDKALTGWKDSLQLTNALYSLYKSYRERTDHFESQVTALVKTEPLTKEDWQKLIARVEQE